MLLEWKANYAYEKLILIQQCYYSQPTHIRQITKHRERATFANQPTNFLLIVERRLYTMLPTKIVYSLKGKIY